MLEWMSENLEGAEERIYCTFAQGGVDKVEEIGVGIAGVEIHQLGGVDDTSTSYSQKHVWVVGLYEVNRFSNPRKQKPH